MDRIYPLSALEICSQINFKPKYLQKSKLKRNSFSKKENFNVQKILNMENSKNEPCRKLNVNSLRKQVCCKKIEVIQSLKKKKKFLKNSNKKLRADSLQSQNFISKDTSLCNPLIESENIFKWLIYPLSKSDFFEKNWEIKPLHIKRYKSYYYKDLISSFLIDKILRENHILFTKNVDITLFENNKRETYNQPGRAVPSVVWDYFLNGCSVRILNPQTYIPKLHALNATLQEFFYCFVGSNSYLTPANSQGFAPHYDDIEAFILQVEGKKRWRLYKPRNTEENLPRYSSQNFSDIEIGEPILDTIVEPGDLLYFPRGTIHQGDTFGFNQHSLHVTLSVYQKNTWGDFLEKLLPNSLQKAIQNDIRFRKGLPLNFLRHVGFVYANKNMDSHKEISDYINSLLNILIVEYLNIHETADEFAKCHIHDFLPPLLNNQENLCSVYGGGEKMSENGTVINRVQFKLSSLIRLSRAHCIRLVFEDNLYRIYYSCDNSKEYHEYEIQYLEVDEEFVEAIKKIILKFPSFIKVENLPIKNLNKKIQIVRDLWEKGIIITKKPLS